MEKNDQFKIVTFYRFVPLPDYKELRPKLLSACAERGLKGTILLAAEGLNSTLTGTADAVDDFFRYLDNDVRLRAMEYKASYSSEMPFKKLKVRLKKEIVRMGVAALDISDTGEYADSEAWEKLLTDPDAIVIDTRNDYEVAIGTFKGAVNPNTQDFQQFPQWADAHLDAAKHKKVAMFCTGGIRCEKSTAYLKSKGFEDVYHLKGGILQYLEDTKNKQGLWQGECFVFDDRVTVGDNLKATGAARCGGCGAPLLKNERCKSCVK